MIFQITSYLNRTTRYFSIAKGFEPFGYGKMKAQKEIPIFLSSGTTYLTILSVHFKCLLLGAIFGLLLGASPGLQAQETKKEMEAKRKANQAQIKKISRILNKTTKDKYASLDQLKAINRQLFRRRNLLQNIREELIYIEEEIIETNMIIRALKRDLNGLIDEYKLMVYTASKSADSFQKLSYLFSSKSFNQFLSRVSYMNQYHVARQNQINQINKVRNLLEGKNRLLRQRLEEQEKLIETEKEQNQYLAQLRRKQSEVINELRKKEQELRSQLAEEKRLRKELGKLVASSLAARLEKEAEAKEEEVTINTESGMGKSKPTPVSLSFEKLKGKLPWPVTEGFISSKFGLNPHPVISDVQVENIGVDIRTNNSQSVHAVHEGKVETVTKFTGMNYLVIIKHGNYFTVYANLEKVSVNVSEEIREGDQLGLVYTSNEKVSELQFQIWQNDRSLNPEEWLQDEGME